MIIAVHGDNGFAPRWRTAAERMGIRVKHVNALSNTVWKDLNGCTALLWHVDHENSVDLEFARSVLLTAEQRRLRVYPDHRTVWHFDDKVAQKYLLEAIDAPIAPTWVFFDRRDAEQFLSAATFPLVFKLRGGAGSLNVRMIRSRREGLRMVSAMFGRGLPAFPIGGSLVRVASRARQAYGKKSSLWRRAWRVMGLMARKLRSFGRERGYVLFQEFVPGNDHDVRVTVVGERAFVFMRTVRPGDFRASGSGMIQYLEPDAIPLDMVDLAYSITQKLGTQSLALDFVRDPDSRRPILLEISYSFVASAVEACPGYLKPDHTWVPGTVDVPELILRDLMADEARR